MSTYSNKPWKTYGVSAPRKVEVLNDGTTAGMTTALFVAAIVIAGLSSVILLSVLGLL